MVTEEPPFGVDFAAPDPGGRDRLGIPREDVVHNDRLEGGKPLGFAHRVRNRDSLRRLSAHDDGLHLGRCDSRPEVVVELGDNVPSAGEGPAQEGLEGPDPLLVIEVRPLPLFLG